MNEELTKRENNLVRDILQVSYTDETKYGIDSLNNILSEGMRDVLSE